MPYFEDLLALLHTERAADLAHYQRLTQSASAQQRRDNGLAWYPVAIRSTELTRGDYLSLELERTTHKELAHQFRFGSSAALFSNHDPLNCREEGTITYAGTDRMRITLRSDELPDWASDGRLGVDLLFDNNSYEEMQHALLEAAAIAGKPEGSLVRCLTGQALPAAAETFSVNFPGLNESQQQAVAHILSSPRLSIVHGPPGTGKTTTLVAAITALYEQDNRQLLVVAPSNTAVDLLSEKLAARGMNVVRVGNPARVSEALQALTLDGKLAAHPEMKAVKKLKKQAAEYKNMAHKYKRRFGRAEQEQRKALFAEAHKIMKEVSIAEQYLVDDVLDRAHVITATLVGSNHHTVRNRVYSTVVIDEAGQALEPACWIPILKAQKLVMAGDPFQLPPTIKSPEAARNGLGTTLLEKCIALHPAAVSVLREQYRMHELIQSYSSSVFYHGLLQPHASVAARVLFAGDAPLTFIDTAGRGFDEQSEGTSTFNPGEAELLLAHLRQTLAEFKRESPGTPPPTVGIISPYKEQVRFLADALAGSDFGDALPEFVKNISVNTIDSFQGQERDIVYISLARSNGEGEIGFLADIRRMNVAMTRAKKKLVIVGDGATLSRLPFYADFIQWAQTIGAYRSAWEFFVE